MHLQPSDNGFTLIESLVALSLVVLTTGAVFSLVNPGTTSSRTQPEAVDMQQRARVASDLLFRDLFMAGAGTYTGPAGGPLTNYFAPIIPRRMGRLSPDAHTVARADAITIAYVPGTSSQTTTRETLPVNAADLAVENLANCPQGQELCGLGVDARVLIHDDRGHFDFFTIAEVRNDAGRIDHRNRWFSHPYDRGAVVSQAESHTYYFDRVSRQLRHYDGYQTDVPVVDNVVGLQFEYFGEPSPPVAPKPAVGVANCLYDEAGSHVGGFAALPATGGSLAPLPLSMLNDGPWCGESHSRFDADLLRVRKVRVTLRVQASQAGFRGTGADFVEGGFNRSGPRNLADYTVQFEVSPRNMNLGR
jgi:prepilin-type N-terminal cleavage/methylation domain-containing protein